MKILIDARDLMQYARFKNIPDVAVTGAISRYFCKSMGIPSGYKEGYPDHDKNITIDQLDFFFRAVGLQNELELLQGEIISVNITIDKYDFLTLSLMTSVCDDTPF